MADERKVHPDFPGVTALLPEPKRLWLEALRSGRFRQGRSRLATITEDGVDHCCLGVLCEVAIEGGLDLRRTRSVGNSDYTYNGNVTMPPEEVWEWAYGTGIGVGSVVITEPDEGNQVERLVDKELAFLNDDEGWSFEQIADAIEESL